MSKGHQRRKCQTTRAEEELRWLLATGKITFVQYERKYRILKTQGKIKRRRK